MSIPVGTVLTLVCAGCGEDFTFVRRAGKLPTFCSERCRKSARYGRDCEACGRRDNGSEGYRDGLYLCAACKHEREYGEENRQILELWEEGAPAWYIGEQLGLAETAVTSRLNHWRRRNGASVSLHRLGGTQAERDARRDEIFALIQQGLTNAEIGERIGTSGHSVSVMVGVMRRKGYPIPDRPGGGGSEPVASPEEVVEAWHRGLTYAEMADELGYASAGAVGSRVKRLRAAGYDLPHRQKVAA